MVSTIFYTPYAFPENQTTYWIFTFRNARDSIFLINQIGFVLIYIKHENWVRETSEYIVFFLSDFIEYFRARVNINIDTRPESSIWILSVLWYLVSVFYFCISYIAVNAEVFFMIRIEYDFAKRSAFAYVIPETFSTDKKGDAITCNSVFG